MERAVRCPPPGRGRAGIGPVGEGGAAHAMHVPGGFIARKGYYTTGLRYLLHCYIAYHLPGGFLAHKDHQSLTLLVALSDPHDFAGGGGATWSQALPLAAPELDPLRASPGRASWLEAARHAP